MLFGDRGFWLADKARHYWAGDFGTFLPGWYHFYKARYVKGSKGDLRSDVTRHSLLLSCHEVATPVI